MEWRHDYPGSNMAGTLIVVARDETDDVKIRGNLVLSDDGSGQFDVVEQDGNMTSIPLSPGEPWLVAIEYDNLVGNTDDE